MDAITSVKFMPWILFVLAVGLYALSVPHGYVLDDRLVLTENPTVQKGLDGIPDLLTQDAFAGVYAEIDSENQLQGGRYRPLAQITYALEIAAAGKAQTNLITDVERQGVIRAMATEDRICEPWLPHLINVLLYGLVVLAGYAFLRRLVPERPWVAFLAMGLFAVHPIHTEVVASIKSRDELLSLLFILLALRTAGRSVILGTLFTCLALLSKEYAVMLTLLVPLFLFLEKRVSRVRFAAQTIGVVLAVVGYFAIRLIYVPFHFGASTDPMVEPYLNATDVQAIATKFWVLLLDLKLLVAPYPLQYSYAFEHIPFVGAGYWGVWVSVLVYSAILIFGIYLLLRRSRAALLIFFVLLSLFLVSNLAFSTANMMAERLLFHASFAFCALLAWGLVHLGSNFFYAAFFLLLIGFAALTVLRVPDWRSEETLFIADADKAPECSLIQANAGAIWSVRQRRAIANENDPDFVKELEEKALLHLSRATQKSLTDPRTHVNLGRLHRAAGRLDLASASFLQAATKLPNYAPLQRSQERLANQLVDRAIQLGKERRFDEALNTLRKAADNDPDNTRAHYHIYGVYWELGQMEDANRHQLKWKLQQWRGWGVPTE